MKGKNPLDIQQKGITPISTVLRAATGIVTTCMVDVVVVWVWLTILLRILQKFTLSQHNFTTVTGSPAIIGSFWTVTDREPGLNSKYSNATLTLQAFSQSCEKLTDAIKHGDISGTCELQIIHFKWYGIITQSAAFFTCTHVHYTHTIHT